MDELERLREDLNSAEMELNSLNEETKGMEYDDIPYRTLRYMQELENEIINLEHLIQCYED